MQIDYDTLAQFVLAVHNRPPQPRDVTPEGLSFLMEAATARLQSLRAALRRQQDPCLDNFGRELHS
ncbi:MAG: hypothetical protein E6R03_14140 [Hyphomicrobiaceae bacterium]|nr:MAG: hypothetical protein E6R03_14140 [Hyphomicrobiaceae bacterium]